MNVEHVYEILELRALGDDIATALTKALSLLDTDDDIGVLNEIRSPLARWQEARQR